VKVFRRKAIASRSHDNPSFCNVQISTTAISPLGSGLFWVVREQRARSMIISPPGEKIVFVSVCF
jgi:hypothetical protein